MKIKNITFELQTTCTSKRKETNFLTKLSCVRIYTEKKNNTFINYCVRSRECASHYRIKEKYIYENIKSKENRILSCAAKIFGFHFSLLLLLLLFCGG